MVLIQNVRKGLGNPEVGERARWGGKGFPYLMVVCAVSVSTSHLIQGGGGGGREGEVEREGGGGGGRNLGERHHHLPQSLLDH